jgi:hypothetical protein
LEWPYLPFEKDLALDLYNFEFPLSKDDLYQVAGSGEEDFKKFSVNFYSFAIISPWGRGLSFICLRMICANFG